MNIMWVNLNGVNTLLNIDEMRQIRMWEDNTVEITWRNGDKQIISEPEMAAKIFERIANLSTILIKE